MKRMLIWSMALGMATLAMPAAAQDEEGNVGVIHCMDAKGGAQAAFEEGVKKHMDWHKGKKDTWGWNLWNVITGPDSGRYCVGSFGHKWEDLDSPSVPHEEDNAQAMADFGDYMADHEMTLWVRMPKVSRPAEGTSPMSSITWFYADFGMNDEFNDLIGEFHKAVLKTDMPWRYNWWSLASGGKGGTFALVMPMEGFAGMNPSGKPFSEMLEEAYGRKTADSLLARWRKAVKGSRNYLVQSRPDLSYTPEP